MSSNDFIRAENRVNVVKREQEAYLGYRILNRDLDRRNLAETIRIVEWCHSNMRTPKMMHYVLAVEDEQLFKTNGFIQKFKEKFAMFIRQRNRQRNKLSSNKRVKIPSIQTYFSLEARFLKGSEMHDGHQAEQDNILPVPYLHLHMMVIVDTNHNEYGYTELNICINKALSDINGLESLWFNQKELAFYKDNRLRKVGFLKLRNNKTTIKIGEFKQLHWHDLKTELDDAICRASYLSKLDQKDLLPANFKRGNSFGHTRPPKFPLARSNENNAYVEIVF